MNKQRFIERLNLYLDNELPEEEVGPLLEEIRSNEEYQRLYREYRLIQSAVAQLGDEFAEKSVASPWRQRVYAFGGMAAAVALLALAAQNLSPLISSDDDMNSNPAFSSEVRSVNEVRNGSQFATFELDPANELFVTAGDSNLEALAEMRSKPFSVSGEVTYARFDASEQGPSQAVASDWKPYAFTKAVEASTSKHEEISQSDQKLEYNFSAGGNKILDGKVRFDSLILGSESKEASAATQKIKR